MREMKFLDNDIINKILDCNKSDEYAYDKGIIIVDGVKYHAKDPFFYNGKPVSTKSTANSLIKKEAEFDYNFCEEMYDVLEKHGMEFVNYTRPLNEGNCDNNNPAARNPERKKYKYMIDLYSAYPHVLKYERLPIAGKLYETEIFGKMNFYIYHGNRLKDGSIITDELKGIVDTYSLGTCEFLFATDWKVGSKMGDKLIDMVYKNKETKKAAKEVHYGYFQKRYLQYDANEDCYVRNRKYNHEILMIAVLSQLCCTMLRIFLAVHSYEDYKFCTDAYFFNELDDIDRIVDELKTVIPNYDYRIYDTEIENDEDSHGMVIYKSYPDLPDAPRKHRKKMDK